MSVIFTNINDHYNSYIQRASGVYYYSFRVKNIIEVIFFK